MTKWRKFRRLSHLERRLLIQAALLLPFTALALRLFGFKRLSDLTQRAPLPAGASHHEADLMTRAQAIARIVRIAANQLPVRVNCLPQSLVLWWLLRRHGLHSELRIGVRKNASRLEAHAWVEYLGSVLNDRPDIQYHFAPFDQAILPAEAQSL